MTEIQKHNKEIRKTKIYSSKKKTKWTNTTTTTNKITLEQETTKISIPRLKSRKLQPHQSSHNENTLQLCWKSTKLQPHQTRHNKIHRSLAAKVRIATTTSVPPQRQTPQLCWKSTKPQPHQTRHNKNHRSLAGKVRCYNHISPATMKKHHSFAGKVRRYTTTTNRREEPSNISNQRSPLAVPSSLFGKEIAKATATPTGPAEKEDRDNTKHR